MWVTRKRVCVRLGRYLSIEAAESSGKEILPLNAAFASFGVFRAGDRRGTDDLFTSRISKLAFGTTLLHGVSHGNPLKGQLD